MESQFDHGAEWPHACDECGVELSAYDVAHGYEVCEPCGEACAAWASAELDRLLERDQLAGMVVA